MSDAIIAEDLVKTYGEIRALDGLSLRVPEGTVLGLLGPNGAGKTTAARILTTLVRPDSGRATVAGYDVVREPRALKRVIGLSGQNAAVDEHLTGFENLDMVGRLYHLGRAKSRQRADELLEQFDLVEAGGRTAKGYSGGMRRRLDLAAALVASAAGAVPRRADDRSRPAQPARSVGGHRRPGARGHDAAADHAISRGGRSARRQHRRHRPRPRDRRGHLRRAQEPGRWGATRGHAR